MPHKRQRRKKERYLLRVLNELDKEEGKNEEKFGRFYQRKVVRGECGRVRMNDE